jgi:hypothetical protein
MRLLKSIFLVIILLFTVTTHRPVIAEVGDSPWGEVFNPDGTIRWDNLADLGVTTEEAGWMNISLPGGLTLDLDAVYHRYQTPSGNILVLPSPVTLFFMAQHPVESKLIGAESIIGNAAALLTLFVGNALDVEVLREMGYESPDHFFQAVIDGQENIWTALQWNFIFEVINMSWDSGFLVNAFLMYLNGVAYCDDVPGGCTGIVDCPPGDCLPETPYCPSPSIAQQSPTLTIQKVAPDNPLVIGQDPERRGADILASVAIPPVIFTWYQQIQDPPTCMPNVSGTGGGCPSPASRYANDWDAVMEDNPFWDVVAGEIHCIMHVEIVPEPIDSVQANAQLNPESRYWILNDLAGKYYDAYIHQARINLIPDLAPMTGGCDGNGTCSAEVLIPNVPFADPGTFDLRMWASTSGSVFNHNGVAIPLTQPRVLFDHNEMQVYVTLVTLLPAGDP